MIDQKLKAHDLAVSAQVLDWSAESALALSEEPALATVVGVRAVAL